MPAATQPPKTVLTAGPKGGDALRRIGRMGAIIRQIQWQLPDALDVDPGDNAT